MAFNCPVIIVEIFLLLNDKPMIYHSIKPFEESPLIDKILIIANKDDVMDINNIIEQNNFKKIEKIIEGGEKRQDSVYNGLKFLENANKDDIILIHNAANPFISVSLIEEVIKTAKDYGACAVAIKAKDTIKEADENNFV